jgi:adhesin transport system membrane fusion protein
VRTANNELGSGEQALSIIPGMVASVDIMTGKKTVLDYLLKPINKARQEALRER